MKVRCVRIVNELTGEPVPSNSWLTIGKVYQVLAVFIPEGGALKYRLLGDDGTTPALHGSSQFELVSDFLPPAWTAFSSPYKYFELAPKVWTSPGFWEKYFDGDKIAEENFLDLCRIISEQENGFVDNGAFQRSVT